MAIRIEYPKCVQVMARSKVHRIDVNGWLMDNSGPALVRIDSVSKAEFKSKMWLTCGFRQLTRKRFFSLILRTAGVVMAVSLA